MKNNKPCYLIIDFEDYEAQRLEEMKLALETNFEYIRTEVLHHKVYHDYLP